MAEDQLTEHFRLYECRCRCGCGVEREHVPALTAFCSKLELLRTAINANPDYYSYRTLRPDGTLTELPIIIERAISCIPHNKAVDGKPESYHLDVTPVGRVYTGAADIHTGGVLSLHLLYAEAVKLFSGNILYPRKGIVHVDVREGTVYCAINNSPGRIT